MTAIRVGAPFDFFTDTSGRALSNGIIYVGKPGLNPETNPLPVFWDKAMTIPAAQPVRTIGGAPSRNGSPGVVYVGQPYSVTVKDANGVVVFSSLEPYQDTESFKTVSDLLTSTATYLGKTGDIVEAGGFRYSIAASGATDHHVTTAGGVKLYVVKVGADVRAFGAVGDGVTDDTAAINKALAAGVAYFPRPSNYYLISDDLIVPDGVSVTGDGYQAQIRQTVQGKNGFVLGNDCVVTGVRVKMPVGNNLDLSKQNAVYINGKKNVIVQGNWLELADIAVSGVHVRGAIANITVKGNFIYGGGWSSGAGPAATAADILFYNSSASSRVLIDGNYCLSNNSQGIFADALGYTADIAITNNVCVTLDPATCVQGGSWSEIASGGVRRHGILLGYNSTSVDGPRAVVSGNLCRNTRWTGIYLQGISAGYICANNVCTNNGYELGNSLSGGIYLIQNGNELVEGNLIIGFQNTLSAVGGITINASTTPSAPSKISGNFIRGSAGVGIALGTNTANCEVSENTLIGNASTDISASATNAVGNGGHYIVGNNIHRTSGTTVSGISIAPASLSSLVTRVIGNRVRGFDNAANNTSNVGIRCVASVSLYDIKGNTVENFYHGVYFANYQTTNRDAQIEGNTFVNCSVGISMGATGNATVPVVDNRFIGTLVSETAAALGGANATRICTREGTRLIAHTYNALPTNGVWEVGDRAMYTTPVASGSIGAVCVTAGTPGTWKAFGTIAA